MAEPQIKPKYDYTVVYRSQRKTGNPLTEVYQRIATTLTGVLGPANERGTFSKDRTSVDLTANDARTVITVRFVTDSLAPIIQLITAAGHRPIHIISRNVNGIEGILDISALKSY